MLMAKERASDVLQTQKRVIFRLNRVQYAIAIEQIQQIIEMVIITPVLKIEAWMDGIINYHGFSVPASVDSLTHIEKLLPNILSATKNMVYM